MWKALELARERTAKQIRVVALLALSAGAAACTSIGIVAPDATPTSHTVATPTTTVTTSTSVFPSEQAEIRNVVERFGKRLQDVSLQSPDAPKQIKNEYADYVAPELIERWASDLAHAPGRVVSSPWPDGIEINSVTQVGPAKYNVTGNVLMMTSMEVGTGRAAGKIPVQLTLQRVQGRWMITEYSQAK